MSTAPTKVAQTLGAAAGIGVAGPALLALPGEASFALKHIATEYGAPAIKALSDAAESHPLVAKVIGHALADMGALSLAKYMKLFGK